MEPAIKKARFSVLKNDAARDVLGIVGFVLAIIAGIFLLNSFVFQTYSVEGGSMEATLHSGDRVWVNKVPVTVAGIQGKKYMPERGTIIVFQNPLVRAQSTEQHVVKRVIGLPGERITVKDGVLKVYTAQAPNGFEPDKSIAGPQSPSSGDINITVPDNELFVAGDNRIGQHSLDSRNGLSTISLDLIEGPVSARIWPLQNWRWF